MLRKGLWRGRGLGAMAVALLVSARLTLAANSDTSASEPQEKVPHGKMTGPVWPDTKYRWRAGDFLVTGGQLHDEGDILSPMLVKISMLERGKHDSTARWRLVYRKVWQPFPVCASFWSATGSAMGLPRGVMIRTEGLAGSGRNVYIFAYMRGLLRLVFHRFCTGANERPIFEFAHLSGARYPELIYIPQYLDPKYVPGGMKHGIVGIFRWSQAKQTYQYLIERSYPNRYDRLRRGIRPGREPQWPDGP